MKAAIIACMLLMLPLALACKDNYDLDETVIISDVIETAGENADCNITLYHNNTINDTGMMNMHGLAYNYDFGVLKKGAYVANIECNKTINASSEALFLSECKFDVGMGGENLFLTVGIIMMAAIGLIILLMRLVNYFMLPNRIIKYMIFFVAGWLIVAAVGTMTTMVQIKEAGIENSVGGFYHGAVIVMVILTIFMGLDVLLWGLSFFGVNIGFKNEENETNEGSDRLL